LRKGLEESGCSLILQLAGGVEENREKKSGMIAGVPTVNRTELLSNTRQELYRHINLLGNNNNDNTTTPDSVRSPGQVM
jgi:hypothetical protein